MRRNISVHLILPAICLPLGLALTAGVIEAQLPGRMPVPAPSDPAAPPAMVPTDPRLDPQPAVRPGTVQRAPVAAATRDLVYLQPGEPPASFQVTATGPRSVTLAWSAPAGASGYWIHRAGQGQTTYYRGGSLVTETTTTINGLLPSTSYSFKVSAVYPQELQRREGMSPAVTAMTAPAPAPTGLTATVAQRGQVSLRWDGLTGADGFRLSRNDSTLKDIKPLRYVGGATLATTFGDSVMPGTHRYQIQALYVVEGAEALSALAPSPAVSVTIPPGTRVIYCQTRTGAASCADPAASTVTIAANGFVRPAGRK